MSKQFLLVFGRNAWARVFNVHTKYWSRSALAICPHSYADAALFSELHCITQYIDEDLPKLVDIAHDVTRDIADHLHRERQLFIIRADATHHFQVFEQQGKVECRRVQCCSAG